jgi:hypothetical protein
MTPLRSHFNTGPFIKTGANTKQATSSMEVLHAARADG